MRIGVGGKSKRSAGRVLLAALLGAAFAMPLHAQDGGAARGLIVKLRAPLAQAQRAVGVEAETERLQRVLGAAGLEAATTRPVGATMRHVDFGRVLAGAEAAQLAARLRERPEVEWVEPNVRERRLQNMPVPNDPRFADGSQWWLKPVSGSDANPIELRLRGVPGVQQAWMRSTGSAAAVVAVLDTGITAHPDLSGKVLPGRDFVSDVDAANDGDGRDANPSDRGDWVSAEDKARDPSCELQPQSSWHGTKIAGLLAAATNNATGGAGISWNGRVLPVRVAGKCGADIEDILDGMRWAAGMPIGGATNPNPARILNISFGGTDGCGPYDEVLNEIRAAGKDIVVVAAAGNEHGAALRPAKCAGVVGVVALNRDGFKSSYSNFGAELATRGLATVGGDWPTGGAWDEALADDGLSGLVNAGQTTPGLPGYGRFAGTSFSAPIVAGVASLMLSVNPALTAQQLLDGLRASARPHVRSTSTSIAACSNQNPGRCVCTSSTCGAGIVDAVQALVYARDPAGYQAPNWPAVIIGTSGSVAAGDIAAAKQLSFYERGQDRPANTDSGGGSTGGSGGSGGGALGAGWLLGLALAVAALARGRFSASRR